MWKNLLSGKKKLVKKVEFLEVNSVAENSDDSFDGSSGDGSDTCGLYVVNGRPESEKEESLEFQSSKTALKQKIDVDLRITSLPRIRWQEKYEFLLSLVSDPRFLVKDALKAEQAKLTLKSQAFLLEKSIVTDAFSKCKSDNEESQPVLRSQLRKLNEHLTILECRLEVLRSVQQVLPLDLLINDNVTYGEQDSLEIQSELKREELESLLRIEKLAHRATRRDLEWLKKQYDQLRHDFELKFSGEAKTTDVTAKEDEVSSTTRAPNHKEHPHLAQLNILQALKNSGQLEDILLPNPLAAGIGDQKKESDLIENLKEKEYQIIELQQQICDMEKNAQEKLQKEMDNLSSKLRYFEVENTELRSQIEILKDQSHSRTQSVNSDTSVDSTRVEPIGSDLIETQPIVIIEATRKEEVIDIEEDPKINRRRTYKISNVENPEVKQLRNLLNDMQQKEIEYLERIRILEKNLKNESEASERMLRRQIISLERKLQDTESSLDSSKKESFRSIGELNDLKSDFDMLRTENKKLRSEVDNLRQFEREHQNCNKTIQHLEKETRVTAELNKVMYEDLNRERVLRKKYYNIVEEMKGKIRVFCRIRPMTSREKLHSTSPIAEILDAYSLRVDTKSGFKEYQFDQVYGPDATQEDVFKDVNTLVQSAYDGYNVCICAYGQTGSGKTFTIIGEDSCPGIAPRTFEKIFELANDYAEQFSTDVSMYMVELHNDRLVDLLKHESGNEEKLEIKKDKKGIVWIQGCTQITVYDSSALLGYFMRGTENRKTASTLMNEKSSRSHLVVGIAIECTNRLHGTKTKGKISLLDLAGSERVSKSGVSSNSLKEATFINKSLSALGDVISALTTDQEFIPYRNSKLTMLLQDSFGGNAKTLMFVNVSPAIYNLEETLNSLTYASRAKQITNTASRLAESKEIVKLKAIISKLRRGEPVDCRDSIS
ncbi:uncharacterized protein LOC136035778 [Artemia franciscana]|uniref:uncharacterized protein LOC136035778 n=1 Tax=Artemia franciscana TaxID=6661 RepID=UPI0032DBB1AB